MIAVQLAKPFIKFDAIQINYKLTDENQDSYSNSSLTTITTSFSSNKLSSNDINLKVPYWLSALVAIILALLFFVAQLIETKNGNEYERNRKHLVVLTSELDEPKEIVEVKRSENQSKLSFYIHKLFLGDKVLERKAFIFMMVQICLLTVMFIFNQGLQTVMGRFMLTYLTLGPAKLDLNKFGVIQTLFWIFFIIGRFVATFLAYKMNELIFFLALLILNLACNLLFLIPALTNHETFFWIAVSLLGLFMGPITPSGLGLAKKLLEFNSFVLSLFIVGLAFGGIIFQQLTAALLDYFKPSSSWLGFENANSSFIIPYLAAIASFFCLFVFLPVFIMNKKFIIKK